MMLDKFLNTIIKNNLIEKDEKVLVACSGGADSMTLLNLFLRFFDGEKDRVEVAHINHCLRGEDSIRDEKFVENFCKDNGITFHLKVADVTALAKKNGLGIEDMGRKIRYGFFEEITKNRRYKIALAHSKDDQVETVFMRILRGTGTEGLMGIKQVDGKIIRPILDFSRVQIELYVKEQNIEFVQDKTNFENDFTRNKIRNELIPYLRDNFNPNIKEAIIRLSDISKSDNIIKQSYIERLFKDVLIKIDKSEIRLDKKLLSGMDDNIVSEILRYCIGKLNDDNYGFEYVHYQEFSKALELDSGKMITINGINVSNSFGDMVISKVIENELKMPIEIGNQAVLVVNGYRISVKNQSKEKIIIRKRSPGDKVFFKGKYKKLKDLMIDKKVDIYRRDYLPVVVVENQIAACGHIYYNNEFIHNKKLLIEIKMEE